MKKEIILMDSDMKTIIWESLLEQLGLPEDTTEIDLTVTVNDYNSL